MKGKKRTYSSRRYGLSENKRTKFEGKASSFSDRGTSLRHPDTNQREALERQKPEKERRFKQIESDLQTIEVNLKLYGDALLNLMRSPIDIVEKGNEYLKNANIVKDMLDKYSPNKDIKQEEIENLKKAILVD